MKQKLSFMLPLAAGHAPCENDPLRFRILLASFLSFFALEDLEAFWIVSPPQSIPAIEAALRTLTSDARFKIISEYELFPELPKPAPGARGHAYVGWNRQQALKLAIAERITTDYYVAFDADSIAVKAFSGDTLIVNGKALCNIETPKDYNELYIRDWAGTCDWVKQDRTDRAALILGVDRPARYEKTFHGETPAAFSVEGILALKSHLEERFDMPWREALLEALPWTEYELYFTFLEWRDMLEELHQPSHRNAVLRLDDSFFAPTHLYRAHKAPHTWDASRVFGNADGGPFITIQSYLRYPPELIAAKVKPYLSVDPLLGDADLTTMFRYHARDFQWKLLRMVGMEKWAIPA